MWASLLTLTLYSARFADGTFKSSRLKALKWVLHKVVQKKNADDARLFVCGLSI